MRVSVRRSENCRTAWEFSRTEISFAMKWFVIHNHAIMDRKYDFLRLAKPAPGRPCSLPGAEFFGLASHPSTNKNPFLPSLQSTQNFNNDFRKIMRFEYEITNRRREQFLWINSTNSVSRYINEDPSSRSQIFPSMLLHFFKIRCSIFETQCKRKAFIR